MGLIITIVSICVAAFSILLLVLFLTGIITVNGYNVNDSVLPEGNSSVVASEAYADVYEYLWVNGAFSCEKTSTENLVIEWVSNNGLYKLQRFERDDRSRPFLYSFTNEATDNSYAWVCDPSLNCYLISGAMDFLAWCEEIGLDAGEMMKQIAEALERYARLHQ